MQMICPINQELTQNTTIFYTFTLSNTGTVVDTIASSVNITAANVYFTTINYNFKSYYFQLLNPDATIATANVTLSVATAAASLNNVTSFFYFDTVVANNTMVKVTATADANAVLYSNLLNLTQVQSLQLTKSIKFITNFTVSTTINGTGINGSCIGTCYLQLASAASSVVVSANSISYTIIIEGLLAQVVLNPTFSLQQKSGFVNQTATFDIGSKVVS
jgi:hypothetical protein